MAENKDDGFGDGDQRFPHVGDAKVQKTHYLQGLK